MNSAHSCCCDLFCFSYTVYPKKYAHGFVVLCFVVVMQSFIMNSHEVFIHIHQGCFAGTGAIVRLPQCQWSKPEVYPKKYAHGFVVLCFVVVMQSFIMNSHEVFIHIHQGCFAGTGAIVRLPQCQWSKPEVYPKKYAHGFVVLCFVVVMQSFIMNSHEVFIHIHQGCFAGTGAIVRLPQCQWSKPDGYGKISPSITTTKHNKQKPCAYFLGYTVSLFSRLCHLFIQKHIVKHTVKSLI